MSRRRTTAERLERAAKRLGRLEAQVIAAHARSESATPGGLTDYDSAILTGIMRKPDHKGNARRWATYDRESLLWAEATKAADEVHALERQLLAESTAASGLTVDDLANARFVRDRYGWHKVVRVSLKSVTVETGYSWTDRIALDKVLEVRP